MSHPQITRDAGRGRHAAPLTCAVDGLAHIVSDDAAAEGIAAGRGTYVALCGHTVHAAALICSTGRPCPDCTALVETSRAPAATGPVTVRRIWQDRLRRLFGRDQAVSSQP